MTTQENMTREVSAAAKWWRDELLSEQDTLGNQAGDEPDGALHRGSWMFETLSQLERKDVTPEKAEAFRDALAALLLSEVDRRTPGLPVIVGTDYGPDGLLGDALTVAGIRPGMTILPLKTTMRVEPGHVEVGKGYAQPFVSVPLDES